MKIIVTLGLLAGLFFWPVILIFGVGGSSPLPSGTAWKVMIIGYAPAAILTLTFMWVKKWSDFVWLPFLLLLIIAVTFFVLTVFKFQSIKNATREIDQVTIRHDLDGIATIMLPQSFSADEQYNGETARTYQFVRDRYGDFGGYRDPVSLDIQFYKEGIKPDLSSEYYNYIDLSTKEFSTIGTDVVQTKEPNHNKEIEPFESKGILIYTPTDKNYRIFMTYWDSYLNDEAAVSLFETITRSIEIKRSLEAEMDEYWRLNPEEKVAHDRIEANKAIAITMAEKELLKRYPDKMRKGHELKYFQSNVSAENIWRVQYHVEKPFTNVEIVVDVANKQVISFEEQEFD